MSKKTGTPGHRGTKKKSKSKGKQKPPMTSIFLSPSTGISITTRVPDFNDAMAVVSAATTDAEELTMGVPDSDEVKGGIIIGHVMNWFTKNYVKLKKAQIRRGKKVVRKYRKSVGINSMPSGDELISHITLLYVAPTAVDRAHLMAHVINISGLAEAIGDEALQEALSGG